MVTLKELRALAKDYGLPGRSKLKKYDLLVAIAALRNAEFVRRFQRATRTGRFPALRGDLDDPHKKGRRARELIQIDEEVDAVLRAKKSASAVEKKPQLRLKRLKRITDRFWKPHLHGHTRSRKETLARVIKREGPIILKNFLDPGTYYGLVVEDVPVLFPDGSYVKRGYSIGHREKHEACLMPKRA